MFKKGDLVAHPSRGAGKVTDIREVRMNGSTELYYYIDLPDEGMLILPVEQADDIGLRPVIGDPEALLNELSGVPTELSDNYRTRQAHVTERVYSGDPKEVARALRDLVWRGRRATLPRTDLELKAKAKQLLSSELALKLGLDCKTMSRRLDLILRRSVQA